MLVPHLNYRLNPNRAIYINGVIDEKLVARLTPEILQLQSVSREPISVYIDSRGGSVQCMETILRLLKLSDQDSSQPCRIITAVTSLAGSAAADLLASGDYAVAFPSTIIHYHGLRTLETNPLTFELTSNLANTLRIANDEYAMRLAEKIDDRFRFRYMLARAEFIDIRKNDNNSGLTDLECFIRHIRLKLSDIAKDVLDKAKVRHDRYERLLETVFKKKRRSMRKTLAQIEADHINAIAAFEIKNNQDNTDWSFSKGGIGPLVNDFFLWNEYFDNFWSDRLREWCLMFAKLTIPPEKVKEIEALLNEKERADKFVEVVGPILEPISAFFVALCHTLQEGENELTARDAYWLGIVDEIVGEDLPNERWFTEFKDDAKNDSQVPSSAE